MVRDQVLPVMLRLPLPTEYVVPLMRTARVSPGRLVQVPVTVAVLLFDRLGVTAGISRAVTVVLLP